MLNILLFIIIMMFIIYTIQIYRLARFHKVYDRFKNISLVTIYKELFMLPNGGRDMKTNVTWVIGASTGSMLATYKRHYKRRPQGPEYWYNDK